VTKSQTASFLLSVFVCGFFLFAGWPKVTELLALWIPQDIVDKIAACSFLSNCQAFQKGLIDTSELVYAVSLSLFFLALTWFTLEFAAAVPSGLFSSGILKNRASRNALGKFVLRFTWILLVCISMFIIGNTWKYRLDVSHDQAYSISPVSKQVAADLDGALYRARNIAAPKNAQRLSRKTPCAANADRCYNCKSPERICRNLSVLWEKPSSGVFEVVLIDETLGY